MYRFITSKACLWMLCIMHLAACSTASVGLTRRATEEQQDIASSSTHPPLLPNAVLHPPAPLDASSFAIYPISFDDLISDHFYPLLPHRLHLSDIIAGEHSPHTILVSDTSKRNLAPIIDLTHPLPYPSLNALMARYQHLHVYRLRPDDTVQSIMIVPRSRPVSGVVVMPGPNSVKERIREIEYVKRKYGENVAWARFHKLFSPVQQVEGEGEGSGRGMPTWADIVASELLDARSVEGGTIRERLDRERLGRFRSLDRSSWFGVRVGRDGVANHLEEAVYGGEASHLKEAVDGGVAHM